MTEENNIKGREVVDMASDSSNSSVIFTRSTERAFARHLLKNMNKRRVSQRDKEIIIEWLTKPDKQPSSQKEFSRRNYVQNTFNWDEKSKYKGGRGQTLSAAAKKGKGKKGQTPLAAAKKDKDKNRTVITTERIADIVEIVHRESGHGSWDRTWEDVSTSCYGILRSDVNFLVQRCQVCAGNPSKRPKGSAD
jgi:hypothetical protein